VSGIVLEEFHAEAEGPQDGATSTAAAQIAALGSSALHEAAGQIGALPAAIRAITPAASVAGPAVTVCGPPGDNLWLHRAVYECKPGDVLIAYVGAAYEWGYWGEVLSCAALERRIAAVVIDGCVRDVARLAQLGLPVFGRGSAIRGTAKHRDGAGSINRELILGDVVVHPGDWVIGDEDGVVALPQSALNEITQAARRRVAKEAELIAALRTGKRTVDVYDSSN
jgi:4-hydroxy-4-methyl-2-oxoglutarate aldolase